MKLKTRKDLRAQRHARVRAKIIGSSECPRLAVMISNRHMYAQMIDDGAGATLAAVGSKAGDRLCVESAQALGKSLGEAAAAKGLSRFVVDRGGFRFHGRVKAIVSGVQEAGLTNVKEAK